MHVYNVQIKSMIFNMMGSGIVYKGQRSKSKKRVHASIEKYTHIAKVDSNGAEDGRERERGWSAFW